MAFKAPVFNAFLLSAWIVHTYYKAKEIGGPMLSTHLEATTRYEQYREEAREYAFKALPSGMRNRVRFTAIDFLALAAFRTWELMPERKVGWDWSFAKEYTFRHPKAFDLAVWSNKTLCSLTLGRPSYRGTIW